MGNGQARARGFSLVELVGVVVILAALAALGTLQLVRVVERAKAAPVRQYLAALRAAQKNYRQADLERGQAQRPYTGDLRDLDVALPDSIAGWERVNLSSPGDAGLATVRRSRGWYQGQQLGIQYGSGTLCGTFEPFSPPLAPCQAD